MYSEPVMHRLLFLAYIPSDKVYFVVQGSPEKVGRCHFGGVSVLFTSEYLNFRLRNPVSRIKSFRPS